MIFVKNTEFPKDPGFFVAWRWARPVTKMTTVHRQNV